MIHILGGGTYSPIRNHLALCAPAFGQTAKLLEGICNLHDDMKVTLHLTKMADPTSSIVTNADVAALLNKLVADPDTKIIFMNAALCDFNGQIGDVPSGFHAERLRTINGNETIELVPSDKVIGSIRKTRKDIFVVGFKTSTGATSDEQYRLGLNLLKANSLNLVLANDTVTRNNMIIVPEESRYGETTDRLQALAGLVHIARLRSTNTFTRSTVVEGNSIPWSSELLPDNLKAVVEHCIARGAYKPFRGVTAGHFAVRAGEGRIITSKRKHDFRKLQEDGMVLVEYDGTDKVIAHGTKPSVGGQSQRIVFAEHPDVDCIVHFHCPMKPDYTDNICVRQQFAYECGSHECGKNTSGGLIDVGKGLKAVMLDKHGPNIVFSKDVPAQEVIAFIERNFDLDAKTGGLVA